MYKVHKLELILHNMEDCLSKLDAFNDTYKSVDNLEIKLYMEEGFKSYINNFQQEIVNYLSHTRKGLYNRNDKLTYNDIIEKHKSAGLLENVSIKFLNDLRLERNEFAHKYEQPTFQAIYEFYKRYRCEFLNVIACVDDLRLNQIIKDNDKNKYKTSGLDEVKLYNSIEIARNLLDVLDDDTISKKTGLPVEFISSLR